jgi:proteasome accessory factor B
VARPATPAERILRLARYLDATPEVTLEQVVDELDGYDASRTGLPGLRKQLRRDLDTLEGSFGILVDYDPAAGVYRLQPPFFTEEQRRALIAAAATVAVDGLDEAAPGELGSALDDQGARVVVSVHRRVAELSEPIATRTPVRFRYHGRERTVEAYAMGAWRNRWYLVGFERERGRSTRYRLDRIDEVDGAPALVPAGEPGEYELPAGFDARAELRMDPNAWGHDPLVTARVRVDADHLGAFVQEFEPETVEGDTVAIAVRHHVAFLLRLLAFRDHVRLLGPPELVEALRAWLAPQAGPEG